METLQLEKTDHSRVINLASKNGQLGAVASKKIVQWASDTFSDGLYALSSFGAESALLFKLIRDADFSADIVTVDTGFLFDETHEYKKVLQSHFDLNIHTFGPSDEEIDYIEQTKLWKYDIDKYHQITKIEPLHRAIKELGAIALLSGIRSNQTENRTNKQIIEYGDMDEYRIHPVIDWSEDEAKDYMDGLPIHPLVKKGYGSIGDKTTTIKGAGREGRILGEKKECGIHISNGKIVRSKINSLL